MRKTDWLILSQLIASSTLLAVNFLVTQSPIVGIIATILYFSGVSTVLGKLLFQYEDAIFRAIFSVLALLIILTLVGAALILLGKFTETATLAALISTSAGSGIVYFRFGRKKQSEEASAQVTPSGIPPEKTHEKDNITSLILTVPFILCVIFAFRLLLYARTGEGTTSVWLTIPSNFVVVYLTGILSLALVLFFTRLNTGIKLAFISVFSFLSHSLFLLVWYPGRYGDPWVHLGEARYIVRTGMPYAYSSMLQNSLWFDLVKFRGLDSLVAFFTRMFYFDIYWIYVLLVPVLWSVFTPLLAYKTAEMLAVKRSHVFPFLAALVTVVFTSLVDWGSVSVPNSLGFIFFFVTVAFIVSWARYSGKSMWLMALLAVAVSILAHLQSGSFAFMFFFLVTVVQRTSRKMIWVAGFLLGLIFYPAMLYLYSSASLVPAGLFQLSNIMAFQSEILTILLIIGLVGLILGIRGKLVSSKISLLLFVFYVVILLEYYFTRYGMSDLPYGAGRILAMADFLLVPFVALGLLTLIAPLRRAFSHNPKNISTSLSSRKLSLKVNPRFLGFLLVALFISLQATSVLYQAYSQSELVRVQPSTYEIDAIRFIDSNSTDYYVVLCDGGFTGLAIGFLGSDYAYGGGRGLFGSGEYSSPTLQMYWRMTTNPSIGIMREAMNYWKVAKLSYFVVSVREQNFDVIVQRSLEIFPAYRVFGDGKLYVFWYPLPIIKEAGSAVRVFYDDGLGGEQDVQTTYVYSIESEINSTLTLTGHNSYNVTDFPMYWTFLGLTVNNATRPFDNSSDVNTFIYIRGLDSSDVLSINWLFNRHYPKVGWKEDSFKRLDKWHTDPLYSGTIVPTITSDGNVLRMSYTFVRGSYQYYYYVTSVNVSTNAFPYLLMRWRSNQPVAVASIYYESGGALDMVPLGSMSLEWSTIVVPLESDSIVRTVMVGLSNVKNQGLAGQATLEIDYILLSAKTA